MYSGAVVSRAITSSARAEPADAIDVIKTSERKASRFRMDALRHQTASALSSCDSDMRISVRPLGAARGRTGQETGSAALRPFLSSRSIRPQESDGCDLGGRRPRSSQVVEDDAGHMPCQAKRQSPSV